MAKGLLLTETTSPKLLHYKPPEGWLSAVWPISTAAGPAGWCIIYS
jgi:hypothetical protein